MPLHSKASARAAAAAIDAFHISDGLGGRRGGAFSLAQDNARRRMSLDNSALEPAAGWAGHGQALEGCALSSTYT